MIDSNTFKEKAKNNDYISSSISEFQKTNFFKESYQLFKKANIEESFSRIKDMISKTDILEDIIENFENKTEKEITDFCLSFPYRTSRAINGLTDYKDLPETKDLISKENILKKTKVKNIRPSLNLIINEKLKEYKRSFHVVEENNCSYLFNESLKQKYTYDLTGVLVKKENKDFLIFLTRNSFSVFCIDSKEVIYLSIQFEAINRKTFSNIFIRNLRNENASALYKDKRLTTVKQENKEYTITELKDKNEKTLFKIYFPEVLNKNMRGNKCKEGIMFLNKEYKKQYRYEILSNLLYTFENKYSKTLMSFLGKNTNVCTGELIFDLKMEEKAEDLINCLELECRI